MCSKSVLFETTVSVNGPPTTDDVIISRGNVMQSNQEEKGLLI